jgi:hemoglobin
VSASPYEAVGGEAGVRALVDRFYDLMDSQPEMLELRRIHPEELTGSREKLFLFLSGWLGGPQLFVEKFGHPRLRARHMPFSIGDVERDQWMHCMRQALSERQLPPLVEGQLLQSFQALADHMRNRA